MSLKNQLDIINCNIELLSEELKALDTKISTLINSFNTAQQLILELQNSKVKLDQAMKG